MFCLTIPWYAERERLLSVHESSFSPEAVTNVQDVLIEGFDALNTIGEGQVCRLWDKGTLVAHWRVSNVL